jgi:hypothetical protein
VPGPLGAFLCTGSSDYIGFQSQTSRAHQDHIVLHLTGHLIAGHCGHGPNDQALRLMPGLQGRDVRGLLCHGPGWGGPREREAEEIAVLISQWAGELNQYADRMPPTAAGARLAAGLTDHLGWL